MGEKLIDNKQYGRVGDVLKRNIKENSKKEENYKRRRTNKSS